MLVLTGEIREKIENAYNYYLELYAKQEEPNDKNFYLGKCSGIEEVLSIMGYKTKIKYGVVLKEDE